jgi:hypothetical protein
LSTQISQFPHFGSKLLITGGFRLLPNAAAPGLIHCGIFCAAPAVERVGHAGANGQWSFQRYEEKEYRMNTFAFTRRKLVLSVACLAALAGWASYSAGQQVRPQAAGGDAGRRDNPVKVDGHMASCLILGNQNEIAAARTAESKAESEEVRNLAQDMVKDHSSPHDDRSRSSFADDGPI